MNTDTNGNVNEERSFPSRQVINLAIQLLVLGLLLTWCFKILSPFVSLVIWGVVLAVALYPLHQKLKKLLKQRGTLAAVIITIVSVCIIILPAIWLAATTAKEIKAYASAYRAGNLQIPPPKASVQSWPVVGGKAYEIWSKASTGLDSLAHQYPAQVKAVVGTGLGLVASTSKGVLLLMASIIIAGVFLSYSESSAKAAKALFNRLAGHSSFDMATISAVTIRNVVKGILGVAIIQSTMAAIGFIAAGIPAAGLWVLCCLILAIVQIGTLPVAIPVIILAWSGDSTLTATLFTIWMIIVSVSDNILKPILLGKGAPVPMLVVFLGAIGGFILSGFIGLFTGAVVLSLGYKLFEVWLNDTSA
jgi:predicted PurR-regulated permease PerM